MANDNNIYKRFGFKIPDGYFETLEDSTRSKLESESYSKKSGYKIPNQYFEELKVNLPSEEKTSKVIRLQAWSRWIAAASIAVFAILGAIYIDDISPVKNIQFSDLDDDLIEKYLDYHLESPEEFIDFDNTSLKNLVDENIITLNDQDIMEYLNDKLDDQDYEND